MFTGPPYTTARSSPITAWQRGWKESGFARGPRLCKRTGRKSPITGKSSTNNGESSAVAMGHSASKPRMHDPYFAAPRSTTSKSRKKPSQNYYGGVHDRRKRRGCVCSRQESVSSSMQLSLAQLRKAHGYGWLIRLFKVSLWRVFMESMQVTEFACS